MSEHRQFPLIPPTFDELCTEPPREPHRVARCVCGHYREALEYIAGCFPEPGRRVTYGDPSDTLDRIRVVAEEALVPPGCPCVGTPEQDDCPHE